MRKMAKRDDCVRVWFFIVSALHYFISSTLRFSSAFKIPPLFSTQFLSPFQNFFLPSLWFFLVFSLLCQLVSPPVFSQFSASVPVSFPPTVIVFSLLIYRQRKHGARHGVSVQSMGIQEWCCRGSGGSMVQHGCWNGQPWLSAEVFFFFEIIRM